MAPVEIATLDVTDGRDWWPTGSTFDVVGPGGDWTLGRSASWLVLLSVWRPGGASRKYVTPTQDLTP